MEFLHKYLALVVLGGCIGGIRSLSCYTCSLESSGSQLGMTARHSSRKRKRPVGTIATRDFLRVNNIA